ncbi:DUF805 domain-containing protein [Actinoallomurus sp. NBC_01490]|jgi:uncharacterized membrane protein YhaH (DUF805 family)|uniref:DUF805 domain-containing protein n=1 Tax=Actinoallomurus sp. NBC_01490 TaxID=2903557 RepID=UPI002E3605F8|nr:DUF805 domain-containing protein [Actinoallomurus sp. NBC_01490]
MAFVAAIESALRQSFDWRGRASRAECWLFYLLYLISWYLAGFVGALVGSELLLLVPLALVAPVLGVTVRRLHDTGRTGWFYFLGFVPLVSIALLVFCCERGHAVDNRYGPPPVPFGGNTTVRRGMTRWQVTRLLGQPHETTEAPARGYWHYLGLPDEGRETMLTFERGRVVDVAVA